ncbi:MAG TPA: helix-turn-helix domain-containing protein [Vicinamibacterales bacterium]|nr:helix-turn-helix domain-containing protein [Vicinamibacterales bacterium]
MINQRQIVQEASALLRDHVAEGVRIGAVSRAVGVSERTLRNAFHREHGVSPKQFDLRERLEAARRALCDITASESVTTIASQYGFFELGRFAGLYKHVFGESPSQTLRNRRGRAPRRYRGSRVRNTWSRTIEPHRDSVEATRSNRSAMVVTA